MELISFVEQVMHDAEFSTKRIRVGESVGLAFESITVLGFVFAYENTMQLISSWTADADQAIGSHQLALRRAGNKAWNAYVILISAEQASFNEAIRISAIEEDLVGTRKIVFAGVKDLTDARAALLPLLPIQSSPKLEATDIPNEIRQRTTHLPGTAVEAFLSSADGTVVVQVLEESQ